MSVFGIICETNPIHNGHKYLIDRAREKGADTVVCVMSGNTVQRGEFAIAHKYLRAETLLRCGADLVLELPYPWSSSSAEYFAHAAIHILRNFCDMIIFGSECGDKEILTRAAELAYSTAFREEYNARITEGEPSAGAYFSMLERKSGIKLSSNDLLGIEYLKAAKRLSANLDFETVRRLGDGYNSSEINNITYPSATAIRKRWQEKRIEDIDEYIPKEAVELYARAIRENNITDYSKLDLVLLTFFRSHVGNDFNNIVGAQGGLANRICEASHKARSADELLNLVKNKRYTDSYIRRMMLYCLAGAEKSHVEALPEETLLLSANKKGRELLSKNRKQCGVKVHTKPADLNAELPQSILTNRIDAIYTLLRKDALSSDEFIKKGPYIV